jgi:hypothetical protein
MSDGSINRTLSALSAGKARDCPFNSDVFKKVLCPHTLHERTDTCRATGASVHSSYIDEIKLDV